MPKNPFKAPARPRSPRPKVSRPATPRVSRAGGSSQMPGVTGRRVSPNAGVKAPKVRVTAHTGVKSGPRPVPKVPRPQ